MKEILLTEKRDGIPCVIIFPCVKQAKYLLRLKMCFFCLIFTPTHLVFGFLIFVYIYVYININITSLIVQRVYDFLSR